MLDRLPAEVWSNIFALACRDNGLTGQSLSTASHATRALSATCKLQSISLLGHDQLTPFVSSLEQTPPALRRVRHLFVSFHSRDPHLATTKADFASRDTFYAAFDKLLHLVSSTLEILHYAQFTHRPFILAPTAIEFPKLTEMTLYGPTNQKLGMEDSTPGLPALRRLHLVDCGVLLLNHIPAFPDCITDLRMSLLCLAAYEALLQSLETMGYMRNESRVVTIDCPCQGLWYSWEAMLILDVVDALNCLVREHRCLRLHASDLIKKDSAAAAEVAWLNRLAGKMWW